MGTRCRLPCRTNPVGNLEVYLQSRLDADQVLDFGFAHVCLATGSSWRRDGVGRAHLRQSP